MCLQVILCVSSTVCNHTHALCNNDNYNISYVLFTKTVFNGVRKFFIINYSEYR